MKPQEKQENSQEEKLFLKIQHFPENLPTAQTENLKNAKSTSLRVIQQVDPQNRAETECFRQFYR